MKNRPFTCAILILLFTPSLAAAQDLSDYCHVYVIDLKVAIEAVQKYPTGNAREDAKLLARGITIVGRFSPKVGEEELTTKTYRLPDSDQIITASVFYTDEMMFSTRLKVADSMLVGVAVSKKAQDNALTARDNAIAEITYIQHTDTVRVKTQVQAQGRQYIVGVECRCRREFDETDPNRQAK